MISAREKQAMMLLACCSERQASPCDSVPHQSERSQQVLSDRLKDVI